MKPNIKHVAKAAGVSISMVSRVLTGRGYVREDKKEKVRKVVREMGYHPSALARGLRDRRTRTLGLLFSWISQPTMGDYYYREILSAAIEVCARRGYELLVSNFVGRLDDEGGGRCLQFLGDTRLEGVLMLAPRVPPSELRRMAARASSKVVLINHHQKGLNCVDTDQRAGMEAALRHLVSKGHRRIGFLAGETGLVSNASERWLAFREGMLRRGLARGGELVFKGVFTAESGEQGARALLGRDRPPTALVASSDLMAEGAMRVLGRLPPGRRPDLVGFDDRPESARPELALTTLRQPFYELGREATEALIALIEGKAGEPLELLLPMQLVVRKSA